ncbi:MAG: hypothetical protein ABI411_21605 [Tahibacter sp.]
MYRTILSGHAPRFAIALLVGALPLCATVHAETQLNHNGGFCVASGSSGTLSRKWQGTITNAHTSEDLRVLCPLVRVAGQNTTGLVQIHTIDRNRFQGIDCGFYDQRAYGHDWTWSGWTTSVGSGTDNFRTFSFGPYNSQDKYEGFHQVHCVLPPSDAVYGESVLGSYSSGG